MKVCFKDLSVPLKVLVVMAYMHLGVLSGVLILGFLAGLFL